MTASPDTRLALVDAWFAAFNARDLDALDRITHPDVDFLPLLAELPGAGFHGHSGVRSAMQWSYEQYPKVRIASTSARAVNGYVLGIAEFVVDDPQWPAVIPISNLFEFEDDLIRRVRSFEHEEEALARAAERGSLTPREREIFQLLARGLTAPEIADQLVLSPATVRTHVQNGIARLGAKTRVQAVSIAIDTGQIEP